MISGQTPRRWKQAIPPRNLDHLIAYVSLSWNELRTAHPLTHAYQNAEPDLTISLCQWLNLVSRKQRAGVSGSFAPEAIEPKRVAGRLIRNGRSDIRFTLGVKGAPEIIFEFKKLDGTPAQRVQYVDEGIMRFVTGKYAEQFVQGVMIGLCSLDRTGECLALSAFIEGIGGNVPYAGIPDKLGRFVHGRCTIAPAQADFGTRHIRTPAAGPSPIALAHKMLDCPPHAGFAALRHGQPRPRRPKPGTKTIRRPRTGP